MSEELNAQQKSTSTAPSTRTSMSSETSSGKSSSTTTKQTSLGSTDAAKPSTSMPQSGNMPSSSESKTTSTTAKPQQQASTSSTSAKPQQPSAATSTDTAKPSSTSTPQSSTSTTTSASNQAKPSTSSTMGQPSTNTTTSSSKAKGSMSNFATNALQHNRQVYVLLGVMLIPFLSWLWRSQLSVAPAFPILTENELKEQLQGKEVLIVGGTEGIGEALTRALVRRGAAVTMTGEEVPTDDLLKAVNFIKSNVSTMRGAQDLGNRLLRGHVFDTVVFANGFVTRPILGRSQEGEEEDLFSSYLSRVIILNELYKGGNIKGRQRVYILGYPGDDKMLSDFEDIWIDWPDYKQIPYHVPTLLFNDALIQEAGRRYPGLRVFGVNPGFVSEGVRRVPRGWIRSFFEHFVAFSMKTPYQYVENSLLQLLATPALDTKTGTIYSWKCEELPPKRWFSNEQNRNTVWEHTNKFVQKALG